MDYTACSLILCWAVNYDGSRSDSHILQLKTVSGAVWKRVQNVSENAGLGTLALCFLLHPCHAHARLRFLWPIEPQFRPRARRGPLLTTSQI